MSYLLEDNLHATFTPNSAPGRTLNSNFQPNTGRPVLVIYTPRIVNGNNVEGRVELRSDSSATPTTVRCSIDLLTNSTGLLVGGNSAMNGVLTYLVPIGDFVSLTTVNVSGTPTFSLATQTEIPL